MRDVPVCRDLELETAVTMMYWCSSYFCRFFQWMPVSQMLQITWELWKQLIMGPRQWPIASNRWRPEGRKKQKTKRKKMMKLKRCTECRIFNQVSCLMRNIASPMTKQFSKINFIFVSSTVIICSSIKTDQYLRRVVVILCKLRNFSSLNICVQLTWSMYCMWYMSFIIHY